jgi:transposase-like protein
MSEITTSSEAGHQRRSAQEWAQCVKLFEASGQKLKEFCRENGLAPSSFSYWRRQLRSKVERSVAQKLIEVRPAAVAMSSAAMRIAVRGGICMEVQEGTDAAWVAGVVRALASQAG